MMPGKLPNNSEIVKVKIKYNFEFIRLPGSLHFFCWKTRQDSKATISWTGRSVNLNNFTNVSFEKGW
jgi:hypothetical protein